MRLLEKLWDVSRGHAQRAEAPALVYSEPDLSLQMVRDDFRSDVAELVIDDERQYHRVLAYVRRTSPELAERVKLYKGKRPLFQRYEIEQGIRSTLSRRVPLPSGGSLVFDYGEAFTVVDVNTGRFTGTTKKLEDTILKNNLEAAVEVVRQLRLRDIGGIIVVDFIDMASQKNRDAVLEVLQRELKKDRSKVYVVEISPLGLVEMTRKNVADGVREIMTCECPTCEGTGRVLSDESLAIDMLRNLRRVARESKSEAFRVELEDGVARALIGAGGTGLDELEHETGRAFDVDGPARRAARALRDPGRGHAGRDRRAGAALRAGRRAQPPDPGAAPLRRDRRRVAAQRRLRGPGHRRAAVRGHDAAGARRARDALRRAGRAARRRAGPPVAPSAPRPAAESSTATCWTGSRTSSSPSAAWASGSTSRAACAARSAGRPPSSDASAARAEAAGEGATMRRRPAVASGESDGRRRGRDERAALDRGGRGGGEAPAQARRARSPRPWRQRRRCAHAWRQRRRRGRRQRRAAETRPWRSATVLPESPPQPGPASNSSGVAAVPARARARTGPRASRAPSVSPQRPQHLTGRRPRRPQHRPPRAATPQQ